MANLTTEPYGFIDLLQYFSVHLKEAILLSVLSPLHPV